MSLFRRESSPASIGYSQELRSRLHAARTTKNETPTLIWEGILESWHRILHFSRDRSGREELFRAESAVFPKKSAAEFTCGKRLALFRECPETPPTLRTPSPESPDNHSANRMLALRNGNSHDGLAEKLAPEDWAYLKTAIRELADKERETPPPHPRRLAVQAGRVRQARNGKPRNAARLAGALLERMLLLLYLEILWRAKPADREILLRHEAECRVDSFRGMTLGPLCVLFQKKLPDGKTLATRFLQRGPFNKGIRLKDLPNVDFSRMREIRNQTKASGQSTEAEFQQLVNTVLLMHEEIVNCLAIGWASAVVPSKPVWKRKLLAASALLAAMVSGVLFFLPREPAIPDISGVWQDPERYRYVIQELDENRYNVVSASGFGGEFYPLLESTFDNGALEWTMEIPWNESRIRYETVSISPDRIQCRWTTDRASGTHTLTRVEDP